MHFHLQKIYVCSQLTLITVVALFQPWNFGRDVLSESSVFFLLDVKN